MGAHQCDHQCHCHYHRKKNRRFLACIVCAFITVLLLILLAILFFSVFKPKDPSVQVPSMKIDSYSAVGTPPSMSSVSLALDLQVFIYNPNRGVFYIQGPSSASLSYGASQLGVTFLPNSTQISSQSFISFTVHVAMQSPILVNMSSIYTHPNIIISLPLSTVVTLYGHVTIAGVRSHHPIVVSACNVNVALAHPRTYIQSYVCQKSHPLND